MCRVLIIGAVALLAIAYVSSQEGEESTIECGRRNCTSGQCCISRFFGLVKYCSNLTKENEICNNDSYGSCPCESDFECERPFLGIFERCLKPETTESPSTTSTQSVTTGRPSTSSSEPETTVATS